MAKTGHVYNPDSADVWKSAIAEEWTGLRMPMIVKPCSICVMFYLPYPKKIKEVPGVLPHGAKPDTDNLLKAVMDALTNAGAWKDDCLVFETCASKHYSGIDPGAYILISEGGL
jgi:Holliday junction resolvase RusA-like endonuclease